MTNLWEFVASIVEAVAHVGAGAASAGLAYEPELPDELKQ